MLKIVKLKKYFMGINYNKIKHLELLKNKSLIANSKYPRKFIKYFTMTMVIWIGVFANIIYIYWKIFEKEKFKLLSFV